jgi:hypothetical protein
MNPKLSPGDVAAELKLSKATVSRLITSGRLPAENVAPEGQSPRYLICPLALGQFLSSCPRSRDSAVPRIRRRKRVVVEKSYF